MFTPNDYKFIRFCNLLKSPYQVVLIANHVQMLCYQTDSIESVQKRALRVIYSFSNDIPYCNPRCRRYCQQIFSFHISYPAYPHKLKKISPFYHMPFPVIKHNSIFASNGLYIPSSMVILISNVCCCLIVLFFVFRLLLVSMHIYLACGIKYLIKSLSTQILWLYIDSSVARCSILQIAVLFTQEFE